MKEMPITEHLSELRKRAIRVFIILIVGTIVAYIYSEQLAQVLISPLKKSMALHGGGHVVYLGIMDKMLAQFQIALWSGVILTAPLWFREIWMFILPGLYTQEVKIIRPFIFAGAILFFLGVFFGLYIVFPLTIQALMSVGLGDVEAMISVQEYLLLSTKILVCMGLVFQFPNILLILGFMGLVTKYSLRKWRGGIYVALAAFSAVVTPPDVISMVGLWLPMCLLFEIGIWAVALLVHPYLEKKHGGA